MRQCKHWPVNQCQGEASSGAVAAHLLMGGFYLRDRDTPEGLSHVDISQDIKCIHIKKLRASYRLIVDLDP